MTTFKLSNFLKPQAKNFIFAQLAIAFETMIDLQLPLLIAMIMDEGVLKGDLTVITKYACLYIGLLLLNGIGILIFGYCSAHATNGLAADIRMKTYTRIQQLKCFDVDTITPGALLTRLTSDVNILQDSIHLMLRIAIRAPLQFIGGIIMLLFLNTQFSFILAMAMLILIVIVGYIVYITQPMYKEIQHEVDGLNTITQECIVGLRTIKAYCGESIEKARFEEKNKRASQIVFRVQRLVSLMSPVFMIVMNIALATLLYVASTFVYEGDLAIGEIMAAISYLTQILFALMMLVMIFPSLSRASVSLARIKDVYNLEIEKEHEEIIKKKISKKEKLEEISSIEFKNVSFRYPQKDKEQSADKAVLDSINFSIKKGEKVALLGTTGAGKSTLIKILFGLYTPNSGEVLINNIPIQNFAMKDVRHAISYVLQRNDLFNGTIYENITFGNENITQEQAESAAKIAQADNFITSFEEKYKRRLSSKGTNVSGGQKQRINISRAFIKHSSLLILDDCTSALDLKTERNILEAVEKTNMHASMLIISQKVISVQHVDKIYLLDKGNIVACGTHKELIQHSFYRAFCDSQNFPIPEYNEKNESLIMNGDKHD